MTRYVYPFHAERRGEEVFFLFPQLPEIISALPATYFRQMSPSDIRDHAYDAVLAALQTRITIKMPVPSLQADADSSEGGAVSLSILQAMKLEFYKLFLKSGHSLPDAARQMGKPETSLRRLLDLRHRSVASEIEAAVALFGKRFVVDIALEPECTRSAYRTASKTSELVG